MLGVPGPFLRRKRGADFVLFAGAAACVTCSEWPSSMPFGCSLLARWANGECYLLYTTAGQGRTPQGVAFCISYHGWLPAVQKKRI